VKGSCLCGAVRFEIDGPGTPMELCHCSRCRKAYGSAFAATFYVPLAQLRWTHGAERIQVNDTPSPEGTPAYRRVFCGTCGSPLPIERREHGVVEIPAGAIEGDPGTRPARHIYTSVKAPWFVITDDLPQHEEGARGAE